MSIVEKQEEMDRRLKVIEQRFKEMGYSTKRIVESTIKKKFKIDLQSETMYGLHTALCVDTIDPWKQNRIRFYSPLLHDPNTPVKSLPWANAISSMGGIDDCGLNWIPPAGSTVCLLFENGNRSSPYYLGTTWQRTRDGQNGARDFGYNVEEFYKISEGHRLGYLVGDNTGKQVFPQWTNESYNGADIDSFSDITTNIAAQANITYPNIYGFKTPEKHMLKMVDGDPKCNRRWKRIELLSGCGNWMIFKDDHLHYAGQWASPHCPPDPGGDGVQGCHGDPTGILSDFGPVEDGVCGNVMGGHSSTPEGTQFYKSNKGSNPWFKHQNECRPYRGPLTPLNPHADLPQSGIQLMSISGITFVMDDSVEEPTGLPQWERSTQAFDYGCTNKYFGRTYWQSAHGHRREMNDNESLPTVRSEHNVIRDITASGNKFEMNDHTLTGGVAGDKRGIWFESTSTHVFVMCDKGNKQSSPPRSRGGVPVPEATDAYVLVSTGYGLQMLFSDSHSQKETQQQYIEIMAPQKTNPIGPHYMRFQEAATGPGQVFLRAGGDYIISTYRDLIEIVGSEENHGDKIVNVHGAYVNDINKLYYNKAESHVMEADKQILLLAQKQCKDKDGKPTPCAAPVIVARTATPCPLFPWMLHWMTDCVSPNVFATSKP